MSPGVMEWILAAILFTTILALLPRALRRIKSSVKGKGSLAGVSLALGMAFSGFLEPTKRTGSEQAAKSQEADEAESGTRGSDLWP
jgi:hypothetical protein